LTLHEYQLTFTLIVNIPKKIAAVVIDTSRPGKIQVKQVGEREAEGDSQESL
jgi:hypothetical protein